MLTPSSQKWRFSHERAGPRSLVLHRVCVTSSFTNHHLHLRRLVLHHLHLRRIVLCHHSGPRRPLIHPRTGRLRTPYRRLIHQALLPAVLPLPPRPTGTGISHTPYTFPSSAALSPTSTFFTRQHKTPDSNDVFACKRSPFTNFSSPERCHAPQKQRYLGRDDLIKPVFPQFLDAVNYCHPHHVDLKPGNVLCFNGGLRLATTDSGLATTEKVSEEFRTCSVCHVSPGTSPSFLCISSKCTNVCSRTSPSPARELERMSKTG